MRHVFRRLYDSKLCAVCGAYEAQHEEVPEWLAAVADQWFQQRWRDLRDDYSPNRVNRVLEALELAKAVGIVSDERAELWRLRLGTCPGHDDEGGRVWCAYCGNVPQATEEDSR